MKSDE